MKDIFCRPDMNSVVRQFFFVVAVVQHEFGPTTQNLSVLSNDTNFVKDSDSRSDGTNFVQDSFFV
jgi:hypothetical protein